LVAASVGDVVAGPLKWPRDLQCDRFGLNGGDVCGNGISKLVFTILSAVAEIERDRIRERIRDVKRHLAAPGVYGGGKRPFGHDVVDGRLVPNTSEQAALARMRALGREEKPLREIGKIISDEFGLPGMAPTTIKRLLDRAAPH
jgi:putative DNA-invertase from lambdoid prophage Rac